MVCKSVVQGKESRVTPIVSFPRVEGKLTVMTGDEGIGENGIYCIQGVKGKEERDGSIKRVVEAKSSFCDISLIRETVLPDALSLVGVACKEWVSQL